MSKCIKQLKDHQVHRNLVSLLSIFDREDLAPSTTNKGRQIFCLGLGIKGLSHLTLESLITI